MDVKKCYNCTKQDNCEWKKHFEKLKINSCPDWRRL